ncbi:MAG: type II toxin-antitoxin system RelE/ParE family toxin [Steroidobacteraceae bacterium]|nr:type II toxin-antitoxin system RelE/ParE family toxin [Steroidobacteraceae bacterium]
MKYEFHPEAEQESYEAASLYESEVSELGLRFVDEVERVIRLLLEQPLLGSRLDDEQRRA